MNFHQRLQPLGERRFAAADRTEQIEDLLALFEALRGVAEEPDDALDGFFHAVESGEGRIGAHGPVQKNTAKAWVLGRVNHLWLTDRSKQPLGRIGISHRVSSTRFQIFRHRHVGLASSLVGPSERIEQRIVVHDPSPHMVNCWTRCKVPLPQSAPASDRESASALAALDTRPSASRNAIVVLGQPSSRKNDRISRRCNRAATSG